jgi:hypothetical protein
LLCNEIHRFTERLDVVERVLWAAAIDMYDRPGGDVSGEFGEGVAGASQRGGVATSRMTSGRRKSSGAVGSSLGYSRVYFIGLFRF